MGSQRQRRKQGIKKKQIHHAGFVDDDQRGRKRGLSVTLKGLRAWVVFQQTMQGGRWHPCHLREPLRRPAGGSRRKERQMLLCRHGGERLAEERLARPGPAGHHR